MNNQSLARHEPAPVSKVGHFITFGFIGQIAFTILEVGIGLMSYADGNLLIINIILALLLLLPIGMAIFGLRTARVQPFHSLESPLVPALCGASGFLLGLFNLLFWIVVQEPGYC